MSGQNRSSAVMQQRQEARNALDDFPTPMWATRALCEWLKTRGQLLKGLTAREPCANRGFMVVPLQEEFASVLAADVHDYGAGYPIEDYLFGPDPAAVDWTVMNPPFRLAQQFIERALRSSKRGVAVFVRAAFLEGETRFKELFSKHPPTAVLQFVERVVIHRGAMRRKGERYVDGNGVERSASSATAYCWLIWSIGPADQDAPTEFHWIPPSQKALERPEDYHPRGDIEAKSRGTVRAVLPDPARSESGSGSVRMEAAMK